MGPALSVHTGELADAGVASAQRRLADALQRPGADRAPRKYSREAKVRRALVLTDAVALAVAFAVIELSGGFHGGQTSSVLRDLALLAFGVPVWILLAHGHNLYHADSRRADHGLTDELMPIIQMTTLWSWAILLGISATGVRHVTIPKLSLFWGLTISLLLVLRSATRFWARRQRWYVQNAVVIGPLAQAATVVMRVLRHPEYRLNLVACVDTGHAKLLDEVADRRIRRSFGDVPTVTGDVDAVELVRLLDVDRVIFSSGAKETPGGAQALYALADVDVHIDLIPTWSDVVGRRVDYHELEGMPLLTVPHTLIRRSDKFRKRFFDVLASAIALTLCAPVFLVCAIAIKLDSAGPVLFRQRRVGRGDRCFYVLKFRSMYNEADTHKHEVAELNFHGGGNARGMFKIREDPRVTRVGRWLRRTSLDELPQLINVLKGDMSLVGPRPLIENEDRQVEGHFRRRLTSSPGLTGPWQIHGRSDIPFEEMINLDYLYVTNWSLWGDVKLVLRTVRAVVRGQGAY